MDLDKLIMAVLCMFMYLFNYFINYYTAFIEIFFLTTNDIFIQNACCIHTSKAQATYEVFHINIVL